MKLSFSNFSIKISLLEPITYNVLKHNCIIMINSITNLNLLHIMYWNGVTPLEVVPVEALNLLHIMYWNEQELETGVSSIVEPITYNVLKLE